MMRRRFMMQRKETIKPYMHIEALEDGLIVTFSPSSSAGTVGSNELYYSLDGSTWNVLLSAHTPTINTGEKLYFKGELKPNTQDGIGTFAISKKCNVGGNAMSLLFGDNFQNQISLFGKYSAFSFLFDSCDTLISVSDNFLPATILTPGCYDSMFYGCTSLVNAPKLPATTLAALCYQYMFYGCTSLTTAPELLATTLVDYCYQKMFYGCSNLNYIKILATDISGINCLKDWVSEVASTGIFVKNPTMTSFPIGEDGIPSGWTVVNDGEESGGDNLIVFTIKDTSILYQYKAEEGMTWGEWVNSSYNIEGFSINSYGFIVNNLLTYVIFDNDNRRNALGNDVIRDSGDYSWTTDGGSGPA